MEAVFIDAGRKRSISTGQTRGRQIAARGEANSRNFYSLTLTNTQFQGED